MSVSTYTDEVAADICVAISEGKSLVAACKELGVEYKHVFKWITEYPDFKDNYARAREAQADYLADEVVAIADEEADPAKARVRVDARKWYAGKLKPKKYGDKQQVDMDVTSKGESINPAVSRLSELAAKINVSND